MKKSQFNTSLVYENKNYIYNAFSNKFIALDPTIAEILATIRTPENMKNFQHITQRYIVRFTGMDFL